MVSAALPGSRGHRTHAHGIQRLNQAHGTPQTQERGYHETLTLFWLKVLGRDIANAAGASILELAHKVVPRYTNKRLPLEYYSRDRLMSWEARLHWVEPDLKPIEECVGELREKGT